MSNLREEYKNKIKKKLMKDLKKSNIMSVPDVKKIVVNIGLSEALENAQAMEKMEKAFSMITGQKPVRRKTKKSISNFNLKPGDEVGLMVTLRGKYMWDFLEKLIKIVLPRVKDFRGVNRTSFDGAGNYSLGIREHTVFPEVDPNEIDKVRSLQVTIVTTTTEDEEGLKLLEELGMPFAKEEDARSIERMEEMMEKDKKDKAKMKVKRMKEGKKAAKIEVEAEE